MHRTLRSLVAVLTLLLVVPLSMVPAVVSPPVALAAYAAASISGAGANETAVESIRLGFVKLLVPFLFVTMPGILMIGTPVQIVLGIILAAIAVTAVTIAFAGWLVRPISWAERGVLALGALLVCWPTPVDSVDTLTLIARAVGLIIIVVGVARMATATPRPSRQVQTN